MSGGSIGSGMLIGGYRFEAQIGAGGMGTVYRAVHAKLGRKAAVKVLADTLANNPEYLSRFFREARIVGKVGHPNIIDILDFVELQSPRVVAYVMELVEGPSLAQVLKSGPLTPVQSINVALQLIDALIAVHAIEVIHRDLKPENILVVGSLDSDLSTRPCIKVLDFGIAKYNARDKTDDHHTSTGMILGTPAYMAPEQVAAESVSAGTDVYAVGELLFEMLTGRRLFAGDNMSVFRAKVAEEAPEIVLPREIPGSVKLAGLIRACLAHDQKQRPPLSALQPALRELLNIQPVDLMFEESTVTHLRPERPHRREPEPEVSGDRARVPKLMAVAVGIALALVLATVGGVMVMRETEPIVILPLEPDPEPPPPKKVPVVAMPPVEEKLPAMEPLPKKRASSKKNAPLKKDEFPAW